MSKTITHYELSKKTAEWQLKNWHVILYEYNTTCHNELPDVLCYKDGFSVLYEIKITKEDFKKDSTKECRVEKVVKYFPQYRMMKRYNKVKKILWESADWKPQLKEFVKQTPHLGNKRYYVCPNGLIQPEEITNGFGLYYLRGARFYLQKPSANFKRDIFAEHKLITHAFRKYASGQKDNILINTYKLWED